MTPTPLAVSAATAASMFDVSRSTWWQWVKDGRAPQPVKINGLTRWRMTDLQQLLPRPPPPPGAQP